MVSKKIWLVEFEATGYGAIYTRVFFQEERPTDEQLEHVIGWEVDGHVRCEIYEVDAFDADEEDVAEFVNAYDIEDFINDYAKPREWNLKSVNTIEIYIPE